MINAAGYFQALLGRLWPKWTGPEEPGARSPSAWLERRNVGLRGTTNNGKATVRVSLPGLLELAIFGGVDA